MRIKPRTSLYNYTLVVIGNVICAETKAQRLLNSELEDDYKTIILN